MIILRDHDFLLRSSNFANFAAFMEMFSHIFTAHAQKQLFMNFRWKFWHQRSISWPQFPYRERHFADLRTFSFEFDFCIGWAERPPNFYFRSSWPTDLESVSRVAYLPIKISTKFEVDTTFGCLVIAFLLQIRYVTLWPWPFTFWPWSVTMYGGSYDQPLHQVWRSCDYPFSSYEFWHLP